VKRAKQEVDDAIEANDKSWD